MYIVKQELGYRELFTLAEFMREIANNGISGDCAECFYYDFANDCAVCETENGNIITSND